MKASIIRECEKPTKHAKAAFPVAFSFVRCPLALPKRLPSQTACKRQRRHPPNDWRGPKSDCDAPFRLHRSNYPPRSYMGTKGQRSRKRENTLLVVSSAPPTPQCTSNACDECEHTVVFFVFYFILLLFLFVGVCVCVCVCVCVWGTRNHVMPEYV